jgi:hypothetical protein
VLAEMTGFEHRFLTPSAADPERGATYDRHTACAVADGDRGLWMRGQWDGIPSSAAILRGSVFEVASTTYYDDGPASHRVLQKLPPDPDPDGMDVTIRRAWDLDAVHGGSAPHRDGLAAWATWATHHPQAGLDWRDRVYLEQRMSSWAAAVEQGLDLTGTHRLYLANCHDLLSTALSLPRDLLYAGAWQTRLIERLSPTLLEVPINPPDAFIQRTASRVRYEWTSTTAAPRRASYLYQRARKVAHRISTRIRG